MNLGLALLLIAVAGLAATVWSQFRALEEDAESFKRKRRRSGIALAVLLLVLGIGHAFATGTLKPRLLAPEQDGSWGALSIDGRRVSPRDYRLAVADGAVAGGRDGCNDWGFVEDEAGEVGERRIVSTLMECPDGDPARRAFWTLALQARLELLPDGTLRLAGHGHEAIFRRCRWVRERPPEGTAGSGSRICAFE